MTQERHDSRASQISDRGLVYAYQMCILHIQKDPGYLQMQREYMMLLNIMDALVSYDITFAYLTQAQLKYLFELSTLVLSSQIQQIIRYTYTGTPIGWLYFEEGLIIYRKGYRNGMYVIDKSIDGGFTWELDLVKLMPDETVFIIGIDAGIAGMRQVVRDNLYRIDMEITPLGFAGVENTDWENIFTT